MSEQQTTWTYPIDQDFDAVLANRLARLETYNKHYYRPNSYLHKWWARRCGTTFRLILKQLVSAADRQDFYAPGGLEGKIILDPMIGGGTTLHEAVRLGASVVGVDLDPIPILQARATLTDYPFSEIEAAFADLYASLSRHLAPYFTTQCPHCDQRVQSWFTLYGARRSCACGAAILVDSLTMRQEPDGSLIRLCPFCRQVLVGDTTCACDQQAEVPLLERRHAVCPSCRGRYRENLAIPYYQRYEPLLVSGHCPSHHLFMRSLDNDTSDALRQAEEIRKTLRFYSEDFAVEPGRKSIQLLRRGIDNYLDLFSSRQLLVMQSAADHIANLDGMRQLNLALLLSTSLEFNSLLSGYKGKNKRRPGAIRHAFAHHAYSFPYTALENNPIYHRRASGTLQKLFHTRLRRARSWAALPRERDLAQAKASFVQIDGEVDAGQEVHDFDDLAAATRRFLLRQGSAARLDLPENSIDAIVTDPPYFDSIQYSDLSAFFRVWLRQMLPQSADWDFPLQESAVDPHNNDADNHYAQMISQIFTECYRVLRKKNGRLIFTYHHWNPRGWAALTNGLKQAGFMLLNFAVVHSENPISVHIAGLKALTHDAILVFGPAGMPKSKLWQRPPRVNTNSSAQFCSDCAALLGWMLDSRLTNAEISALWQSELA
jgi:putative DNA methylase